MANTNGPRFTFVTDGLGDDSFPFHLEVFTRDRRGRETILWAAIVTEPGSIMTPLSVRQVVLRGHLRIIWPNGVTTLSTLGPPAGPAPATDTPTTRRLILACLLTTYLGGAVVGSATLPIGAELAITCAIVLVLAFLADRICRL